MFIYYFLFLFFIFNFFIIFFFFFVLVILFIFFYFFLLILFRLDRNFNCFSLISPSFSMFHVGTINRRENECYVILRLSKIRVQAKRIRQISHICKIISSNEISFIILKISFLYNKLGIFGEINI
jgi:hypothetical protein